MPRTEPDPKAVFSPEQWTAIAKSISLDKISPKEQREICIALMGYEFNRINAQRAFEEGTQTSTRVRVDPRAKERKALEQFVQYARGLRLALNSVEHYLRKSEWIDRARQLSDEIYEFQRFAEREVKRESVGGRPALADREALVGRLAAIYERITGNPCRRSFNPETGRSGGPCVRFISTILEAKNISTRGLRHVIAKIAQTAKNPA